MKSSDKKFPNSLPEMLEESVQKFAQKNAFGIVDSIQYNFSEFGALVNRIATMLYGIGVEKGNKVSIIAENSPHWSASYFGIQKTGGVTVPALIDFSGKELYTILDHSEANVVMLSTKQLQKLADGFPKSVQYIVTVEDLKVYPIKELPSLLEEGQKQIAKISPQEEAEFKGSFPELHRDDLAVIIYTSGTTGNSKGVMLSHDNLVHNAVQTGTVHQVIESDVFLSVLPLAHTYESTIGMLIPVLNGASVYYIDRAPTAAYLGPILKKIRPTTMLTVPLIIEKIYRNKVKPGIMASPITRAMSKFGPTRKIVHKGAGKKLMDFFGGRMRFYGVGGAPLAPDVEKFLLEAKFPYAIGYGLTETAPMLSGFGPDDAVFHSVGLVMEDVEIKINNPDPDTGEGEIVAKGRNIMKGYYKNEAQTKEVFTDDGYFRTGDLGLFDKKGILFIKGRLKNMILGPNGENIYPEEIESVINEMEFVTESLVLQSKGKLVARVHLNFEQIEEKFQHLKDKAHDKQEELQKKALDKQEELQKKAEELLDELMVKVNQHVNKNSRLQLVILQEDPFEKTATLKIKRFMYKS